MIALDMPMPKSCMECPLKTGSVTGNGETYWAMCNVRGLKPGIPNGTRPIDCPLIDMSRYEDDLK